MWIIKALVIALAIFAMTGRVYAFCGRVDKATGQATHATTCASSAASDGDGDTDGDGN